MKYVRGIYLPGGIPVQVEFWGEWMNVADAPMSSGASFRDEYAHDPQWLAIVVRKRLHIMYQIGARIV